MPVQTRWPMLAQRIVGTLAALSLCYFNLASLARVTNVRFPDASETLNGPLPNIRLTEDLFLTFGVFGRATGSASAYKAFGVRQALDSVPNKPSESMIDLDVYQYFPRHFAAANRHMRYRPSGKSGWTEAEFYEDLGNQLQRLHNESHPHEPVEQVFVYLYTWPKSSVAYFERMDEARIRLRGHN